MVRKFGFSLPCLFLLVVSISFFGVVTAETNVTECGIISEGNETYILNTSLNSGDSCLYINTSDITLDCSGYNITYGNSTDAGFGVLVANLSVVESAFTNVTIRNCNFIQNDTATNSSQAISIMEGAQDFVISNNTFTITANGSWGIIAFDSPQNISVSGNTFTLSGFDNYGIRFGEQSTNCSAIDNVINYNNSEGSSGGALIFDDGSSGANVSSNNITSTSYFVSPGILLGASGTSFYITSNRIDILGNESSGILIADNAYSGTIHNNIINVSGNMNILPNYGRGGIFLETGTFGINVSLNTIDTYGVNSTAIFVWGNESSINSNTLTTFGIYSRGVFLEDSELMNVTSNTIITTGDNSEGIRINSLSDYARILGNEINTSLGTSYGIYLDSDDAIIDCMGSSITGQNNDCGQGSMDGISLNNGTNITIKNCVLRFHLRGLMDVGESSNITNNTFDSVCLGIVSASDYLSVYYNNFTSCKSHSFYGSSSHSKFVNNSLTSTGETSGLDFHGNSYNNTIENNTFNSGGMGLYFSGWGEGDWQRGLWRVVGNRFNNRTVAIKAFNLFNSLISNNTITNNSIGLNLFNSTNNTITNNTLQNNTITTPHTDWFFVNTTECINAYGNIEVEIPINPLLAENDSECLYNLTIYTITNHDLEIQSSTDNIFSDNEVQTLSFSNNESGFEVVASFNLVNLTGLNDTILAITNVLSNATFDNVTARISASINLSALLGSEDYNESYFLFKETDIQGDEAIFYFPYSNQTFYESLPCANNSKPVTIPDTGCYVNYSSNLILYIPHFSSAAIGELITITEEDSNNNSPGSSGSSSSTPSFWTNTYILNENETSAFEGDGLTKALSPKNRVRVVLNGTTHHMGVINLTSTTATINVSSNPQQRTMAIGEEWKVDVDENNYYDLSVKLISISNNKANLTIKSIISELILVEEENGEELTGIDSEEDTSDNVKKSWTWLWIALAIIVVVGILYAVWIFYGKNKKSKIVQYFR